VGRFPVRVATGTAPQNFGMLGRESLPLHGIALAEMQALGIRAVRHQDRVAAVAVGAVYVGPNDRAVVHRNLDIPIDLHAVSFDEWIAWVKHQYQTRV